MTGGTSGHLWARPWRRSCWAWPAVLVLTCVVSVQALLFQDGGLLALGANILNMAIVGVFVAQFAYTTIHRLAGGRRWGHSPAASARAGSQSSSLRWPAH